MVGTAVTRVEVEVKRGEDGSDVHTEGRGIFPLCVSCRMVYRGGPLVSATGPQRVCLPTTRT